MTWSPGPEISSSSSSFTQFALDTGLPSPASVSSSEAVDHLDNVLLNSFVGAAMDTASRYDRQLGSDEPAPNPQLMRHLVKLYLRYLHPLQRIVDDQDPDFWTRLDRTMEPEVASIVYAMCTVGALHSTKVSNVGRLDDVVYEFYERTKCVIRERPKDIVTIQTSLILRDFFVVMHRTKESAECFETIMNIAEAIELGELVQKLSSKEKLSPADMIVRNTWRFVVRTEIMVNITLKNCGRVPPLKDLSSSSLDFRTDERPEPTIPAEDHVYFYYGKLFSILQKITRIRLPMSPRDIHPVTTVLNEFSKWYETIPKILKCNATRNYSAGSAGSISAHATTLDLNYRLGHIYLLHCLPPQSRSSPTGLGPRRESPLRILATCANGITAIMGDLSRESDLRSYALVHSIRCLTEAATIQLANSKEHDPAISTPAKVNLMKSLWCIRQFNLAVPTETLASILASYDLSGKQKSNMSRPGESPAEENLKSESEGTREVSMTSDRDSSELPIREKQEADKEFVQSARHPASPSQDGGAITSLLALSLESPPTGRQAIETTDPTALREPKREDSTGVRLGLGAGLKDPKSLAQAVQQLPQDIYYDEMITRHSPHAVLSPKTEEASAQRWPPLPHLPTDPRLHNNALGSGLDDVDVKILKRSRSPVEQHSLEEALILKRHASPTRLSSYRGSYDSPPSSSFAAAAAAFDSIEGRHGGYNSAPYHPYQEPHHLSQHYQGLNLRTDAQELVHEQRHPGSSVQSHHHRAGLKAPRAGPQPPQISIPFQGRPRSYHPQTPRTPLSAVSELEAHGGQRTGYSPFTSARSPNTATPVPLHSQSATITTAQRLDRNGNASDVDVNITGSPGALGRETGYPSKHHHQHHQPGNKSGELSAANLRGLQATSRPSSHIGQHSPRDQRSIATEASTMTSLGAGIMDQDYDNYDQLHPHLRQHQQNHPVQHTTVRHQRSGSTRHHSEVDSTMTATLSSPASSPPAPDGYSTPLSPRSPRLARPSLASRVSSRRSSIVVLDPRGMERGADSRGTGLGGNSHSPVQLSRSAMSLADVSESGLLVKAGQKRPSVSMYNPSGREEAIRSSGSESKPGSESSGSNGRSATVEELDLNAAPSGYAVDSLNQDEVEGGRIRKQRKWNTEQLRQQPHVHPQRGSPFPLQTQHLFEDQRHHSYSSQLSPPLSASASSSGQQLSRSSRPQLTQQHSYPSYPARYSYHHHAPDPLHHGQHPHEPRTSPVSYHATETVSPPPLPSSSLSTPPLLSHTHSPSHPHHPTGGSNVDEDVEQRGLRRKQHQYQQEQQQHQSQQHHHHHYHHHHRQEYQGHGAVMQLRQQEREWERERGNTMTGGNEDFKEEDPTAGISEVLSDTIQHRYR
ncbi:hypothetical protein BGZ99_001287 [Dissophora globulifera]|uniref:Uncharacterized protein n=1 Tax=Dissophora globulifera TaxID=979702 RepID=A0A9P6RNY9_9FUNG|nr:hypothetical protein BGZ99_001287 [Dissophora globulifera]